MIKFEVKPYALDKVHSLIIHAVPEGQMMGFNVVVPLEENVNLEVLAESLKSALHSLMDALNKEYGNERKRRQTYPELCNAKQPVAE